MASDKHVLGGVSLKIVLVGDSGTGKSSLLRAAMGRPFSRNFTSTIGVDFEIKQLRVDKQTVSLQLYDTAGQERFRTLTSSYYRSSSAILLTYDITNRKSFESLGSWLADIRRLSDTSEIMLLGTKLDLIDDRQVSQEEGQAWAEAQGLQFMETSARSNINIEDCFQQVARAALRAKQQKDRDNELLEGGSGAGSGNGGVSLSGEDGKQQQGGGGCC